MTIKVKKNTIKFNYKFTSTTNLLSSAEKNKI